MMDEHVYVALIQHGSSEKMGGTKEVERGRERWRHGEEEEEEGV